MGNAQLLERRGADGEAILHRRQGGEGQRGIIDRYAANLAGEASVPAHRCGLKALRIIA